MTYNIFDNEELLEYFKNSKINRSILIDENFSIGDVNHDSLHGLFNARSEFYEKHHSVFKSDFSYTKEMVPKFIKILSIESLSSVNLYFRYSLVSQLNLWFTIHLLNRTNRFLKVAVSNYQNLNKFLYADSGRLKNLSEWELIKFDKLWDAYQKSDKGQMQRVSKELESDFPFLPSIVDSIAVCANSE
ncbi:MAG: hypothetical protein RLO81_10405 [Fulvivirga sp.]|uniref:hypothetical protein n=1 Tax=Fulvivirga sp. TaxID=1931237 RepID=UPI0032EF3C13